MGQYKNMVGGVSSDQKVNSKFQELLKQQLKSLDAAGEEVKTIPHNAPPSSKSQNGGLFKGGMMDFTAMLEALDNVNDALSTETTDIGDEPMEPASAGEGIDYESLLGELRRLFTPVLVMQTYEKDIADKANSDLEESGSLTEKTMISFDKEARLAQLIAVCAKLIARQKNTEKWQVFEKAKIIANNALLELQKEEYENAKILAQKFLVDTSTNNASSVARDAAKELLPLTAK